MARVDELRDQRGRALQEARSIAEIAAGAKRIKTDEEQRQYDLHISDVAKLGKEIEDEVRLLETERELASIAVRSAAKANGSEKSVEDKFTINFRKMILDGERSLNNEELHSLKKELVETRGLSAGTDIKGGFTLTPEEFVNQLIVAVKNKVFMRQLATVIPLKGSMSCGVPTLDTDVGDADWTPEIGTVSEDDNLAFGKRSLTPHPLSKLVKVSEPLLRNSALNPEAIVMDRMGYKFGVAMEKGYLTGNGSQQPLGVFTASPDGIPTSRDVSEGNAATTIGADNLIAVKYSLKAQYMGTAQWLFHRDAIKQLAQLKDGEGRYMFDLSNKSGVPDMLLGRPMFMSEYAPNTFTTGQYVGMFADFSHYWIADSLALQFRRLNELFALNNQVGFIGRME
jgi:HK97 family phage major capsid protein